MPQSNFSNSNGAGNAPFSSLYPSFSSSLTALRDGNGNAVSMAGGNPQQQINPDNIDGYKLALAREQGITDGLNADELAIYNDSYSDMLNKYGEATANQLNAKINYGARDISNTESAERSALQVAGDGLVSATNGLAQGLIGTAEFANRLNPLTRALDLVTPSGSGFTDSISKGLSFLSEGVNNIADNLSSDAVKNDRYLRSVKNQLDEAKHAREEREAVANGQSAFTASMIRIAKDAGSGFANALSSPTAILDSTAEFVGSMAAFGAAGKVASLAAKGAGKLAGLSETALTRAEKLATNEMAHVAAQEGGSASLDAYQTAQNMTDEELMQSSEQYREVKAEALAKGASELEAEQIAKDAVANRAATTSALITGAITAPMGKLLPEEIFKSPKGQFVQGGITKSARETVEEGLEGLGQFGSNIGAKVSYNNDQDLAEGVGTNIGEGAASAGVGSGIIQSPSMAKSALKAGYGQTKNLLSSAKENSKAKSNIKTLKESAPVIDDAIKQISDNNIEETNEDSTSTSTTSTLLSKNDATEALTKIKDLSTPITAEEAEQINSDAGGAVAKEGLTKLDVLKNRTIQMELEAKAIDEGQLETDDDKLVMLDKIAKYEQFRKELLPTQLSGSILSHIKDESAKTAVQGILDSYENTSANPRFRKLAEKANKFANEIITANKSIDDIYADESLSNEQISSKVDSVLTAYKYLFDNNTATNEQIDDAIDFIDNLDEDKKNAPETVSFLNELEKAKEFNAEAQSLIEEEEKSNEKIAQTLGISAKEVADFRAGSKKTMQDVASQKMDTLYDTNTTNRKSFKYIYNEINQHFADREPEKAYQAMLDYMNFVQSQVNKENAWKKSKEAYIEARKKDINAKAKAVYYKTYNPQLRAWKDSEKGIYAGHIELGELLVSENERLVREFYALKKRFFDKTNINISNYNPDAGVVTNDFVHREVDKYRANPTKPNNQAQAQSKAQNPVSEQKQEVNPQSKPQEIPTETLQQEITSTNSAMPKGMEHLKPLDSNQHTTPKTRTYAGIGSRETPSDVLGYMNKVAKRLEERGLTLRSGGAKGADSAFEAGVAQNKQIFYPKDIETNTYNNAQQAKDIALGLHPNPYALTKKGNYAVNLMARNGYQVLGADLNSPSDFVLCYAPLDKNGNPTGGTTQAIRIANAMNIPVFNLAVNGEKQRFEQFMQEYLADKSSKESAPKDKGSKEDKSAKKDEPKAKTAKTPKPSTFEKEYPMRARADVIRNRLFHKGKEAVKTYAELVKDVNAEDNGLTAKDKEALNKALDLTNPNSALFAFKNMLEVKIANMLKQNTSVPFTWSGTTALRGWGESENYITFGEALKIFQDKDLFEKFSEKEIENIYAAFPVFSITKFNPNTQKMVMDEDLTTHLFLNAVAQLNQLKDGQGYNFERIAKDLGMDLAHLINDYRKDGVNQGVELLKLITKGVYLTPLISRLSRNIKRSSNIKLDDTKFSYENYSEFSDLFAGLTISTLLETKIQGKPILEAHKFDAIRGGVTVFTVPENVHSILNTLDNPEALNRVLDNEDAADEGDIFVEGEAHKISASRHNTYEHTSEELPEQAVKARDNYEKVEYKLDENMLGIYDSLGEDGLVELFGYDVSDTAHYDPNDLVSKQSKNKEITSAFAQVQKWRGKMQEAADKAGVPLSKIHKRFRYGMTGVNRIQELELKGPTTNKLTREVLLSTWNTVPMDETTNSDMAKAVIQNFGGKLNKNNIKNTVAAFNDLVTDINAHPRKYARLNKLLTLNSKSKDGVKTIKVAREKIVAFMGKNENFKKISLDDVDMNFMGLHAMQALAAYAKAKKDGAKEITTSIYCEADGTTNGTINAQFLLTSNLSPESLEHATMLLDKGNMRIGDDSGKSAGIAKEGDPASECDVYGKSGEVAQNLIVEWLDKLSKKTVLQRKFKPFNFEGKYLPKNGANDAKQMVVAVDSLFRYSGQTKDVNTSLEKFISRNFMKKPDTKGMYGAGLGAILATLSGTILNDLYEKHTKVLKRVKNGQIQLTRDEIVKAINLGESFIQDEDKLFNDPYFRLGVVLFGGSKGSKQWEPTLFRRAAQQYLGALNFVTHFALKINPDGEKDSVRLDRVFNADKQPEITLQTFLEKDGFEKAFTNNTLTNISNAVQTIYGNSINQAIQETIRGENVSGTQESMQLFTSTMGVVSNMLQGALISKINPKQTTAKEAKELIRAYSEKGNPLRNRLTNDIFNLSLVPEDSKSKLILQGGSLYSASTFGYASKDVNPKYTDELLNKAVSTKYGIFGNPGVSVLPNSNIGFGDGMMMQRAMIEMLDKINYATTLIFDGGNAAVGMMDTFGKEINKIQYETDLRNFVELIYQKAEEVSSYLQSEQGKAELHEACEQMAKSFNFAFEQKDYDLTDFNIQNYLTLLGTCNSLFNNSDEEKQAQRDLRQSYIKFKEESHSKNLIKVNYTHSDLNPNTADIKEIKLKISNAIFEHFKEKYPKEAIEAPKAPSRLSSKFISAHKDEFPEGAKSVSAMMRNELRQVLGVLNGKFTLEHNGKRLAPVFHEDNSLISANDIETALSAALTTQITQLKEHSVGVALFHTAAFLMGGTYDHMASLEQAHKVGKPSLEDFTKFLEDNHLQPTIAVKKLYSALMTGKKAPYNELRKLQKACKKNPKEFLKEGNRSVRAKIMNEMATILAKNVVYNPPVVTGTKPEEKKTNKYVKVSSVSGYLKNNQHVGINRIIGNFFKDFSLKGINNNTKIKVITGETRVHALSNLTNEFASDITKTKYPAKAQDSFDAVMQVVNRQYDNFDNNRKANSVQFYSKDTNTIYVLPIDPTGIPSVAEEKLNNEVRLPHEILHALSVDSIDYYDKLFGLYDRHPNSKRWTERDKAAFKALGRIKDLKKEFDAILPSIDEIDRSANPQLYFYVLNKQNIDNENTNLKEFVATFGSMTDDQANSIMAGLGQHPDVNDTVSRIATATYNDGFKLRNIILATRNAFRKFISALFKIHPDSATVRDILFANMAIINSTFNEDREEHRSLSRELFQWKGEKGISFLEESVDSSEDTKVDVDAETASAEFVASPESRADIVKDLSNSVAHAVKNRLSAYARTSGASPVALDRAKKEKTYKILQAEQSAKGIPSKVIEPLKNLGLEVGSEKEFSNVVNLLSLFRDIKSPIYGDVAQSVNEVLKNLYAEDFCDDITNQAQLQRGSNIVQFLQGMSGLDEDLVIPTVFALSQTDPKFREILSKIEYNKERNTDGYLSLDAKLADLGYKMLDSFNEKFRDDHTSTNYEQQLDKLTDRMIKDEQDYNKSFFFEKALDKVNGFIDAKLFEGLLEKAHLSGELEDRIVMIENDFNNIKIIPHAVKELVHDIIAGTDDSYKEMTEIVKAKNSVQQERQNALEQYPQITKGRFSTKLSDEQWSRFTRTIGKSGLATLFQNDTAALMQLISDGNKQFEEMEKCKAVIKDKYRIEKCQQLADYMMTGKAGSMLLRNPVAIAKALGSENIINASQEEIDACDRLVSLMALQKLTTAERKEIIDLLPTMKDGKANKDAEAMAILLNTLKNQEKQGIAKANQSFKGMNNWVKGSMPSVMKKPHSFKVAPMNEKTKKEMERMGYKFIRPYKSYGLENIRMGVYYTDFNHSTYLNAGGLQFTATTANGINVSTGGSLAPNGGRITDTNDVARILNKIKNGSVKAGDDLVPLFDATGTVYAFERSLSPELLNDSQYLAPETDLAKLIGVQEGRNKEESLVNGFNTGIVDMLAEKYEKDSHKNNYVNLFTETDPTIKEVVKLMPADLRKYIESKFGSNTFMVLRSEVNDVIGYHSVSITDSWTGESRLHPKVQETIVACAETVFGKNAFKYLKIAEDWEHDFVVSAKNTIIIRSVVVPVTNLIANYLQLVIEGVPVHTLWKYTPVVTKEISQYVKFRNEILYIDQEIAGLPEGYRKNQLEAAKKVLQKAISNLSIGYLLEQKEFSSIADLGNNDRSLDLSEGTLGDKIIAKIDKMTESEIIHSLTHYGSVAPDTSLYKALEKLNQYGDFMGKAILFKDLTERRLMTPEEAHKVVADEFVNYVRLPGRGRDYLERAGLMWFYNYKLRMMRVMMRNLKQRPLTTLALSACGLPTPLTDSLAGKFGVLGYSIGPSMMWNIFSSNPFLALLGLIF